MASGALVWEDKSEKFTGAMSCETSALAHARWWPVGGGGSFVGLRVGCGV